MSDEERQILCILDDAIRPEQIQLLIDSKMSEVERRLARDPAAVLAWEPLPLAWYGAGLPAIIRSSWVFVLRAAAVTGAERHPNSHQRVMSYRGAGDLQVWRDDQWHSHFLVNDSNAGLEKRWLSIPPNIWHQAVVPAENWVVVSFHTASEKELIEERPDPNDSRFTQQRKYAEIQTGAR